MLYNTIRSRKTPITVRNKLNFIVRRWELDGLKNCFLHYGSRVFGIRPKAGNNVEPRAVPSSAPVGPPGLEEHFGFESDADSAEAQQNPSAKWGLLYERSSGKIFRDVMHKLPLKFEDYTFIDLGAGKGFVLCLAAEFPFKKATGVEYFQHLATAAAENLRTYQLRDRKCKHVECLFGDAVDFKFPAEPTVLYLYNSFQGKVMDRVIRNLKRSLKENPRELWVVYTSPWEHRKFKRSPEFELMDLTWDYAVYRHRTGKVAK